ncbi:unnamed protein product [Phytophthora fragariaefolia]|uniref:Unnamed protein product n=1 Tax=Phytophthora fragariaefolia TaxID=1490495 RepID=A0A9W6XLV0_9STRA|nr:unnamed protein product [Phytophthora fragariaefolia]
MVQKQQALIDVLTSQHKEVKVEGISLPRSYGNMGDSVELYFDQVIHYFEVKNIVWQDENQSKRIIAMMTANFRGNAAACLKHKRCSSLEDYISQFRVAIMQVKDMSELDKITYFNSRLVSPTKEVQYRRCTTVSEALTVALEYNRSHVRAGPFQKSRWTPPRSFGRSNPTSFARANTAPQRPAENEPEPMEIDTGHEHNPRRDNYRRPVQNNKPLQWQTEEQGTNNSYQSDTKRGQFAVDTLAADKPESVEVVEINDLNAATIQSLPAPNELIRKSGLCEGKRVTIMLDTGATCNVIRPGLGDTIPDTLISQVTLIDGSTTKKRTVHKGKVTVEMDGYRFRDLEVLVWFMSPEHDVILGKPWFTKYQPIIDWRTHHLQFKPQGLKPELRKLEVSDAEFKAKAKRHGYDEFYRVKITPAQPVT